MVYITQDEQRNYAYHDHGTEHTLKLEKYNSKKIYINHIIIEKSSFLTHNSGSIQH